MNFDLDKIMNLVASQLPSVLMAFLILIVGFWIISILSKYIKRAIAKAGIDATLAKFLSSVIVTALKIMLLLSVASKFGINTTSFVAILGALTVGIGMALNGSIGHLASGVMLMIFKPFKVGDLVEIGGGHQGTVEEITAFTSTLLTLDNKKIIIANSNVTDNTITNITGQEIVGVELTFGIGYNDSIDKARKIILEVGEGCPHILDDPAQKVFVAELADSSVNLATRPFCKSEHYWDVLFYMLEHVKKAFDAQGVSIPFPQMDIHQN